MTGSAIICFSGRKGEPSDVWHDFFNVLLMADSSAIQLQVARLISAVQACGMDAFFGLFVDPYQNLNSD